MPFRSEAQRRFMYANHPAMAKRWQEHTPKGKLPKHVKKQAEERIAAAITALRRSTPMRYLAILIALVVLCPLASAQGRRADRRGSSSWRSADEVIQLAPAPVEKKIEQPVQQVQDAGAPWTDGLDELNALRARSGLRPYLRDDKLTEAASWCATQRAARLIDGHLPESDFTYVHKVGADAAACGCAAWEPSWGWGSCCSHDNYTYAGAAWAMGRDGKRYMHVCVR